MVKKDTRIEIYRVIVHKENDTYVARFGTGDGMSLSEEIRVRDISRLAGRVCEKYKLDKDECEIETIDKSTFNPRTGIYKDPITGKERADFYDWYLINDENKFGNAR